MVLLKSDGDPIMIHQRGDFDVVVIGSGAGGGCTAHELCRQGLKVLILEKGPNRSLAEFKEGGVFGPAFSSKGRGDELKFINEDYIMPERRREIRYLEYLQDEKSSSGRTTNGWMSQLVGGGTVHYGGASFRYDQSDVAMASQFSDAAKEREATLGLPLELQADLHDWPIAHEEITSWCEHAEKVVGIAGAPGSGLKPLKFSKAARLIDDALKAAQSDVTIDPTPMAINSQRHMGREVCHHSGLCQDFACRFEAKSDMRVTTLREAQASGNLTIQSDSFVRKINHSDGKVRSVECVVGHPDDPNTTIVEYAAPILVVACEAMETNRLLMASGIGNPDILGKYIMFHVTGGARSIAPTKTTTWDTAPHTAFINSFYEDENDGDMPFLKTGILLVSSNGGPLAASKRLWGEDAKRFFEEIYPYKMDLSYIGDSMPCLANEIVLTKNELDRFGMPGTRIRYQPHPFDIAAGRHVSEKAKDVLEVAGGETERTATDDWRRKFLKKRVEASRLFHGCGGARMGEDPRRSVVDANGRVHGVENLFVADASVFPTSGGRNPTLIIQALAFRVGRKISDIFG